MIDHLPRNSFLAEAQASDDDLAAQIVAWQDGNPDAPKPDPRPRLAEFDPVVERLTDIVDRLGEVMQAVIAAAGVTPPKIRRLPRPETAVERHRRQADLREARAHVAWLESQLLPKD